MRTHQKQHHTQRRRCMYGSLTSPLFLWGGVVRMVSKRKRKQKCGGPRPLHPASPCLGFSCFVVFEIRNHTPVLAPAPSLAPCPTLLLLLSLCRKATCHSRTPTMHKNRSLLLPHASLSWAWLYWTRCCLALQVLSPPACRFLLSGDAPSCVCAASSTKTTPTIHTYTNTGNKATATKET